MEGSGTEASDEHRSAEYDIQGGEVVVLGDDGGLAFVEEGTDRKEAAERVSLVRLLLVSMINIGITFGYNAEFILGTPLFQELEMSAFWTSFAWLAGPLAGLIFQPIAGVLSDRYEGRWGRRRPFIVVGAIVSVLGFICFANPSWPGAIIGQPDNRYIQICFAVFSLWLLNIGLNVLQGPAWALVLDICGEKQQSQGNAIYSAFGAAAGIATNLLGFIDLTKYLPFFQDEYHAIFYIGVVVMLLCLVPTLLAAKEVPYVPTEKQKEDNVGFFKRLLSAFVHMSKPVQRLILVFFITNAAYAPYQFYFTAFYGEDVYKGDPSAPPSSEAYQDYQQGVQMGSLGFAIMQFVTMVYAPMIPFLIRKTGTKAVWFFGLASGAVVFLLPIIPALLRPGLMEIIFSFAGIINATTNTIPYALMGEMVVGNDAGVAIGLLNSAQVIAQMFANFFSSIVMALTGTVSWGIAVGGEFALIGCVVVWTLILPNTPQYVAAMASFAEKQGLLADDAKLELNKGSDEEEEA